MKKLAYIFIAVSIVGGAAYALTQTNMLSGDLYEQTGDFDLSGGGLVGPDLPGDLGLWDKLDLGESEVLVAPEVEVVEVVEAESETSTEETATEDVATEETTVEELVEEEVTTTYDYDFYCSELTISPDTFTLKRDENVEFEVEVNLTEPSASLFNPLFQFADLLMFDLTPMSSSVELMPDDTSSTEIETEAESETESETTEVSETTDTSTQTEIAWNGTLIIEVERTVAGEGELIDPFTGTTANKLKVDMTSDYTDFNFIYIDGNVGDVIHAYLEDESDCTDTLTLEAKQSAAEVAAEAAAAEETATEEEVAAEETTTEETTIQEEPEPVVQVVPVCTTVDIQPDSYLVPNDQNSAELTIMVAADADWSGDLTLKSSNDSSIFLNNVNKLKSNPTYISVSGASTTVSTTLKNLTVGDMVTAYIEGEENCTDTLTLEAEPLTAEETVVQEVFADLSPDGENSTDNLTRAEAVKILMVLSGKEGNGTVEHFTDVSPNDWFYDYYVAAEKAGIVHGTLANPNKPITRGDLMVYMARTAEQTLYGWDETDIPFPDLKKSDYYTYAIIIGYQTFVEDPTVGTARVFEGYSNGTSGATKYIARSEAMTLALRFYLAWYANQ